jgi:hypothetical protein
LYLEAFEKRLKWWFPTLSFKFDRDATLEAESNWLPPMLAAFFAEG